MEVNEIKRTEGAVTVELRFKTTDYLDQYKEEIRKIRRELKLPGFRPGQVPSSLIQHRYGPECHREAVSQTIEKGMRDYDEAHKSTPNYTGWQMLESNLESLQLDKAPDPKGEYFIRQIAGVCRPYDFSKAPAAKRFNVTLTDDDFQRYLTQLREGNPSIDKLEQVPDLKADPKAEVMLHCEIYQPEGADWGDFELKSKSCPLFLGDVLEGERHRFSGRKLGDTTEVEHLTDLLQAESRTLNFLKVILKEKDLKIGLKIEMINGRSPMARTVEAYQQVIYPSPDSGVKKESLDTVEKCEDYLRENATRFLGVRMGLFQAMKQTVDLFRDWTIDVDPEYIEQICGQYRKELEEKKLPEDEMAKAIEWKKKELCLSSKQQQFHQFLHLMMGWIQEQPEGATMDKASETLLNSSIGIAASALLQPRLYVDKVTPVVFEEQAVQALMQLVSYGQEKAQSLIQQATSVYSAPVMAFQLFKQEEESMDVAALEKTYPLHHHLFDPQACMWSEEEVAEIKQLEQTRGKEW